jgi:tetratricopeptide (TPR) repeat protein
MLVKKDLARFEILLIPVDLDCVASLQTTLATLSVTLQNLKLPLTAYQMYAWAATAAANEEILTKTFHLGLTVLVSPSKWVAESKANIEAHVLSHMQAVALQCARFVASQSPSSAFPTMLATGWASQAALWQLQWLPKDEKRELILPRLAESMARRLIEQEGETSPSAEIRLLCLRILEHQSKWSEMLDLLEKDDAKFNSTQEQTEAMAVSEFGVSMSWHQVQTDKARVLCQVGAYNRARSMYEDLLGRNPDDWACLKGHLNCCLKIDGISVTEAFVHTLLAQQAEAKYPLRGPHLMKVELAAHSFRSKPTDSSLQDLATAIESYGKLFASRVSCAFSDLEAYIELLLDIDIQSNKGHVESLLDFSHDLRKSNTPSEPKEEDNNKERQKHLRAYIFAAKLNHKLLSVHVDFQEKYLVDWTELVIEWEKTLSLSSSNEGEEVRTNVGLRLSDLMYI